MTNIRSRHYAIVPAAGAGSRMGAAVAKQYLPLLGRPLIHHSLAVLCAMKEIEAVFVVLAADDEQWRSHDWSACGSKLVPLFRGGDTRALSVRAGLQALAATAAEDDWVLVHDGARPCLAPAQLERLFGELASHEVGGLLAVPVADTLKRADSRQQVLATVAREGLWQAQTPQMFRFGLLRTALERYREVTDEAGAIEALGLQPQLVESDASNLKVTYPADLRLAELILRSRLEDSQ